MCDRNGLFSRLTGVRVAGKRWIYVPDVSNNDTDMREECDTDGCGYGAEYETEYAEYCKWCMHAMDHERVESNYPDLSVLR